MCDGQLSNMQVGLGNPPQGMSMTFTGHILALMYLSQNQEKFEEHKVYNLPSTVEKEIITLNFPDLKKSLTELTFAQEEYLGISSE